MYERGTRTVPDMTVRPTAKFLKAGAILAALVFVGLEIACYVSWNAAVGSSLIMVVPLLILLWPAERAFRRRYTKASIVGDRLRYETGMTSKSTRTIQLSRVQDVRVDQSMTQRIFNIGNISIETAGEASRLTIDNVDDPQALADEILNRTQHGATQT
jgi:membrane protein YdbS with pleckstrin-like domain